MNLIKLKQIDTLERKSIFQEVRKKKKKKGNLILSHNYRPPLEYRMERYIIVLNFRSNINASYNTSYNFQRDSVETMEMPAKGNRRQ